MRLTFKRIMMPNIGMTQRMHISVISMVSTRLVIMTLRLMCPSLSSIDCMKIKRAVATNPAVIYVRIVVTSIESTVRYGS